MTGEAIGFTKEQLAEQVEALKKELGEQTRLAEERLNQLHYLQADFDNYRRWSEREKGSVIALANENLIRDILVILDDFERALPALELEENREGMSMIHRKLMKILDEYGLQPIECVGKKFDPNLHEVLCKERCEQEPDTIIEEIGKGYHLKSKVIRPSRVKIAERVLKQ
ncbi:nucleotide exchange factor GrpE [Methanosphaerula subterraneus]|uniref:nucleotide exchange factor GrpE n=1 Tax=Methanosphaerula subterraneus TaxID=3350244 RepID=UPI003F839AF6